MSSVRTIIGRPCSASIISRMAWYCSSSSGAWSRSRKRNSVRSRPTPSAPDSMTLCASEVWPMLATTSTRWPSFNIAGSKRWSQSRSRCTATSRIATSAEAMSASLGCRITRPSEASRMIVSPMFRRSRSAPMATSMGMPSERETMAAWAFGLPFRKQMPLILSALSCAAWEGSRSSAMRMTGLVTSASGSSIDT